MITHSASLLGRGGDGGRKGNSDLSKLCGKYLIFTIDDEEYGIAISKVREIIGYTNISPLPDTPEYVKGIINLRGKVIPIIGLASKFNLPSAKITDQTCIIILEINTKDNNVQTIGIIVDKVLEVVDIEESQIEVLPHLENDTEIDFILGIAKTESSTRILLDIDNILEILPTPDVINEVGKFNLQ